MSTTKPVDHKVRLENVVSILRHLERANKSVIASDEPELAHLGQQCFKLGGLIVTHIKRTERAIKNLPSKDTAK